MRELRPHLSPLLFFYKDDCIRAGGRVCGMVCGLRSELGGHRWRGGSWCGGGRGAGGGHGMVVVVMVVVVVVSCVRGYIGVEGTKK